MEIFSLARNIPYLKALYVMAMVDIAKYMFKNGSENGSKMTQKPKMASIFAKIE